MSRIVRAIYKYELRPGWMPMDIELPRSVVCEVADRQNIALLFADDPRRRRRFLQFLRRGYLGVFLIENNQWAAYAWMSRSSTIGPDYLPKALRNMGVHWIFNCRTHETFRGRGFYKQILAILIEYALKEKGSVLKVYASASMTNIPSRKGILAVGFEPAGVLTSHAIRLPLGRRWVRGQWTPAALHLPIEESQ